MSSNWAQVAAEFAILLLDPIDYNYTVFPVHSPLPYSPATTAEGDTQAQVDAINTWQYNASEMAAYVAQASQAANKINGAVLAGDTATATALAQFIDTVLASAYTNGQAMNAAGATIAVLFQPNPLAGTLVDNSYTVTSDEALESHNMCAPPDPSPLTGACDSLMRTGDTVDSGTALSIAAAQVDYSVLSAGGAAAHLVANLGKTPTYMEYAYASGVPPNEVMVAFVHRMDGVGQPTGSVSFYMDSVLRGTAPLDANGEAIFQTHTPIGTHYWFAVYRAQGSFAESFYPIGSNITGVNQPDTTPPVVSGFLPASGTTVPKGSTVLLKATVADAVGAVLVQTYVNGALQCSAAPGPYTNSQLMCSWTTPNLNGKKTYTILWKATDAAGNVGQLSGTIKTQ